MRLEIAMLVIFSASCLGQQTSNPSTSKAIAAMSEKGHLQWTAGPLEFGSRRIVDFIYSKKLGLRDVDFHPITAKNWDAMKRPTKDAVARLEVPVDLTVSQLEQIIAELNTKGEYRTIEVIVRK